MSERELMGGKHLSTPNEFNGFEVFHFLKTGHRSAKIEFRNFADSLRTAVLDKVARLHQKTWVSGKTEPGEFPLMLVEDSGIFFKLDEGRTSKEPIQWKISKV